MEDLGGEQVGEGSGAHEPDRQGSYSAENKGLVLQAWSKIREMTKSRILKTEEDLRVEQRY